MSTSSSSTHSLARADSLVAAIEQVHDGQRLTLLDGEASTDVNQGLSWPGQLHELTPRQSEILGLIAQDRSNDEIARTLFIGISSVKTHIRDAYRVIDVDRRTQAVVWAMRHGLGAPDDQASSSTHR